MRALQDVAEHVYKPYLEALWDFVRLLEGKELQAGKSFGQLVNMLEPKLTTYPILLECRAGWLRNAAAHGNWRYLPEFDSIEAWDRNHPKKQFTVEELHQIANEMYQTASGSAFSACSLFVARRAQEYKVTKAIVDGISFLDQPEKFKEYEVRVTKAIESGLAPLGEFVKKYYPE